MREKNTFTDTILNVTKGVYGYRPYDSKRPYYSAVREGDPDRIYELAERNYPYPGKIFEEAGSYSAALEEMRYEFLTAAAELSLCAIEAGLADAAAYDIRDSYVRSLGSACSLPEVYDLLHGLAHELAIRVRNTHSRPPVVPSVARMMTYIGEHLRERITLNDIAGAAGLSRNYASELFHRTVGKSLSEYLISERLRLAKRMLAETDAPIGEIGSELRFCSQSHFTQCFRKQTGMTPGEYRRSVR